MHNDFHVARSGWSKIVISHIPQMWYPTNALWQDYYFKKHAEKQKDETTTCRLVFLGYKVACQPFNINRVCSI